MVGCSVGNCRYQRVDVGNKHVVVFLMGDAGWWAVARRESRWKLLYNEWKVA